MTSHEIDLHQQGQQEDAGDANANGTSHASCSDEESTIDGYIAALLPQQETAASTSSTVQQQSPVPEPTQQAMIGHDTDRPQQVRQEPLRNEARALAVLGTTLVAGAAAENDTSPWSQRRAADPQASYTSGGDTSDGSSTDVQEPPAKFRRAAAVAAARDTEHGSVLPDREAPPSAISTNSSLAMLPQPATQAGEVSKEPVRSPGKSDSDGGRLGLAGGTTVVYACVDGLPAVVVMVDAAGEELIELD